MAAVKVVVNEAMVMLKVATSMKVKEVMMVKVKR